MRLGGFIGPEKNAPGRGSNFVSFATARPVLIGGLTSPLGLSSNPSPELCCGSREWEFRRAALETRRAPECRPCTVQDDTLTGELVSAVSYTHLTLPTNRE